MHANKIKDYWNKESKQECEVKQYKDETINGKMEEIDEEIIVQYEFD